MHWMRCIVICANHGVWSWDGMEKQHAACGHGSMLACAAPFVMCMMHAPLHKSHVTALLAAGTSSCSSNTSKSKNSAFDMLMLRAV